MFRNVWVHLGAFRYRTKLGAKWANLVQLMQKFVPQSLVRISRNLRSRSTQLDSKLMFSCVSFRFGAFGTVSLLHKTRSKTSHTGAINAKVRAQCLVAISRNERSRSTPWTLNSCFGAFLSLWVRLGPFFYCTKLGAKWANWCN